MHPDQIKALATASTNLGVGMILAGIIVPAVSGTVGDTIHIALWLLAGASAIALAHEILGRLP